MATATGGIHSRALRPKKTVWDTVAGLLLVKYNWMVQILASTSVTARSRVKKSRLSGALDSSSRAVVNMIINGAVMVIHLGLEVFSLQMSRIRMRR